MEKSKANYCINVFKNETLVFSGKNGDDGGWGARKESRRFHAGRGHCPPQIGEKTISAAKEVDFMPCLAYNIYNRPKGRGL